MLRAVVFIIFLSGATCSFYDNLENNFKKSVERFAMKVPHVNFPVAGRFVNKFEMFHHLKVDGFSLFGSEEYLQKLGLPRPQTGKILRLGTYSISNCSSPSPDKATFIIKSLEISPDPAHFPGLLTISFDIDNLVDVSFLEIDVVLELQRGSTKVKIPCINEQIGSCNYTDVCAMLSGIQSCPPEFDAAKIPCKCPFNKRSYTLPGITFEIDADVFVSGDYFVKAYMTSKGQFLGCYNIQFSIED